MFKFNKIYENTKLIKNNGEKKIVENEIVKLNLLLDDNNEPVVLVDYSSKTIDNIIENIYVSSYLDEMHLMAIIYNSKLEKKYSKNLFLNSLDPEENVIEFRLRNNDYKDAEKVLKLYSVLEKSFVCVHPKNVVIKQYIDGNEINYRGKEECSLELYRKSSNENATLALSLLNKEDSKKYFTNK